jgi:nucleoside-diphosphate-sugar epimerase
MNQASRFKKVLVTGGSGFTGGFVRRLLSEKGFIAESLEADITDRDALFAEVDRVRPDYVLHLAALSFAGGSNVDEIYRINVGGSVNLLDALAEQAHSIKKIVLASSATVYGNVDDTVLSESLCPKPNNHYGCSKLAMEHMAQNYFDKLPLIITRPFNYTGVGHGAKFLIPKIVQAYRDKAQSLELGNLGVYREFNDVRDVSRVYLDLLLCKERSLTVNICSGRVVSLHHILELMASIAGYKIDVTVNPLFVRRHEIVSLAGDCSGLHRVVSPSFKCSIEDTLRWMYEAA